MLMGRALLVSRRLGGPGLLLFARLKFKGSRPCQQDGIATLFTENRSSCCSQFVYLCPCFPAGRSCRARRTTFPWGNRHRRGGTEPSPPSIFPAFKTRLPGVSIGCSGRETA